MTFLPHARFQQIELPLQFRHEDGGLLHLAGIAGLLHHRGRSAQSHAADVGRRALDGVGLAPCRSGVTPGDVLLERAICLGMSCRNPAMISRTRSLVTPLAGPEGLPVENSAANRQGPFLRAGAATPSRCGVFFNASQPLLNHIRQRLWRDRFWQM